MTALLFCDWKGRAASAQTFTLWHQATIKIPRRAKFYFCLFATHGCCSSRTSRSWWIAHL